MMVSARPASARYVRKFFEDGCKVLLDGVEMNFVAEADDEAGYVECFIYDGSGFVAKDGRMVTERKTGKVEFIGKRKVSPRMDAAEAKRARRAARNLRLVKGGAA